MKSNFEEVTKRVVIYCLCGAVMAPTITGFICQNPACPDYLLEKHEHIPENNYLGTNYGNVRTVSVSGTAASSVTTTTIYPYTNLVNLGKGGES